VEVEGVRQRKDGCRVPVAMIACPSRCQGQVAVYGIYRDITEHKRAGTCCKPFRQRLIETQERSASASPAPCTMRLGKP